jgi:alpha-tubulin suppressor-like RCC1 family protein
MSVSAGYDDVVALKTDGTVWSWGANDRGQLGDGTTTTRLTPVQVAGPGGAGFLDDIVSVSAKGAHTLALKADGTLWSWGRNDDGQLGDGTTTDRRTPVRVTGSGGTGFLSGVASVSAGGIHTVAVMADGTVWAWGHGSLGDGRTTASTTPVRVAGAGGTGFLTDVTSVSASYHYTAALKADGTVWTWGDNWFGQLGNGKSIVVPSAVRAGNESDWLAVAAGNGYTVALKPGGTVWDWGYFGEYTHGPIPVQVKGPGGSEFLTGVSSIGAGTYHAFAVKADGSAWTWGVNPFEQLEDGTNPSAFDPVQVKGPGGIGFLTSVVSVAGSIDHAVAVLGDGTVWAWGVNDIGQLGDGTTANSLTPVQVKSPDGAGFLDGVRAVAAGIGYSLALKTDGTAWMWGGNGIGQLGDGTMTDQPLPVQVKGPGGSGFLSGVVSVSSRSGHTLALKDDGTVWAWGANTHGQLGDGTTTNRATPVQVAGPGGSGFLTGVGSIATSSANAFSVAARTDGTAWAWGFNYSGQLGDGTLETRLTPIQVTSLGSGFLSGVSSVAGGGEHTVALMRDGTIRAWGSNVLGEFGSRTTLAESPVQVIASIDGTPFLAARPNR